MSVIHTFPCIQLTDLSSLSSEEGTSPSHRKFSSTSYIMKKKRRTTASKTAKQASLSSRSSHNQQLESKDGERGSAEKKRQHTDIKLLHELSQSEVQNTASSLDMGARGGRDGSIPSICITSQDREGEAQSTPPTTSEPEPSLNQLNRINEEPQSANRQEAILSHSQPQKASSQLNGRQTLNVENGSSIEVAATHGHLFTEEEVQSLQRQIADLQVDLEQLLQYTHVS